MEDKWDIIHLIRKQNEKGNKVEVRLSEDGTTHMSSVAGVTYLRVKEEDYDSAIEEVRNIEIEKRAAAEREKREFDAFAEEASRMVARSRNRGNRVQGAIDTIGRSSSSRPKTIRKENNHPVPARAQARKSKPIRKPQKPILNRPIVNDKRTITGKKKLGLKKKFKLAGLSLLLAGGIAIGYNIAQIPEYKEKAFTDSLNAVKVELSEDLGVPVEDITIRNNSTLLSSNSAITDYAVKAGDKTYSYVVYNQDGERIVREDTIVNEDVKRAISIVSEAQGGNIFNAMRANGLKKDLESGKINFDIPQRGQNQQEIEEDER